MNGEPRGLDKRHGWHTVALASQVFRINVWCVGARPAGSV